MSICYAHIRSMPWLRYRVVRPLTGEACREGESGVIQLVDLANVYSCAFIETDDIGYIDYRGRLVLEGRDDRAEPKGCSLTASDVESL